MLTSTERAAMMMADRDKCQDCKHVSNITHNGIPVCTKGFYPNRCGCYTLKPEIALRQAQEAFK